MVMQQQWFQSIVQLYESSYPFFVHLAFQQCSLCIRSGSGSSSISTPIVLLFNEIVINAHTWTTQLNYNMPILLNEKQFLMCDDKRWHLFSGVCVRWLDGCTSASESTETERDGERIVHCTQSTCTSFRSHPHLVTFPPKKQKNQQLR